MKNYFEGSGFVPYRQKEFLDFDVLEAALYVTVLQGLLHFLDQKNQYEWVEYLQKHQKYL